MGLSTTPELDQFGGEQPESVLQFRHGEFYGFGHERHGHVVRHRPAQLYQRQQQRGSLQFCRFRRDRRVGEAGEIGTVTLTISTTGTDTFTGGTIMNAGLLSIASTTSALGTGPVAMNGGTLYLQAVTLPNSFVFHRVERHHRQHRQLADRRLNG